MGPRSQFVSKAGAERKETDQVVRVLIVRERRGPTLSMGTGGYRDELDATGSYLSVSSQSSVVEPIGSLPRDAAVGSIAGGGPCASMARRIIVPSPD